MLADIIATGDEIRTGALVDRNSAYISDKIEEIGLQVPRHVCVGDDMREMTDLLRETAARADIALVTGGLGPTVDDITRQAAASAKGVDLQFDPEALETVTSFFASRNLPMSPQNRKQAYLPDTAVSMANPLGTAPGFQLRIDRCDFFFMPGVPHEMRRMLTDHVLPAIVRIRGEQQVTTSVKTICTFGLPESVVDEKMAAIPAQFPELRLGLRASFPYIQVKLYGRSTDHRALARQIAAAQQEVCTCLGDAVFSTEGKSMAASLGNLLVSKNATLAVAESCTGGLIANQMTDVPGSSDYFLFSGVTYANSAKEHVLKVPAAILSEHGAVHAETARHMARGARQVSGADYAIATSGIAGPGGGTAEKPVGTLCVGLATPETADGFTYHFPVRSREQNKHLFAAVAMNKLRKALIKTC